MRDSRSIFIYSSEFLPFKGGVGRYTEDMAEMLAEGGAFRVTVFTETANGQGYPDAAKPYRVIRLPIGLYARHPWANMALNAFTCLSAIARARASGAGWFVATGKRSVYNAAFALGLLGPMKLAIVLHGSEWSDIRDARGWRGKALRKAVIRMCQSAQLVVIPNRFTLGRFQSLPGFAPQGSVLLHPIVNPERVAPDPGMASAFRERYFRDPAFSLITVARLTPRKGQDHVIKALGRFAREVAAPFRYFIVGSGSYRDGLEKLIAAENLRDRVFILSGLGDVETYSLLSLCDLFAMPNREHQGTFEGFGIAFLEANVLGIPALAGISGGSTEAVEDGANGLVCDGDDPDDVYSKILRFHKDGPLRNSLKAGCRIHALERFSFARWKTLYQNAFS